MRNLAVKPAACLAVLALLTPTAAVADGIADCEKYGVAFFRRHGADLSKIRIERDGLDINRYDDKVGSQFVSTEYIGFAQSATPSGEQRQRFVCLHAGTGKGAVYFGLIPK